MPVVLATCMPYWQALPAGCGALIVSNGHSPPVATPQTAPRIGPVATTQGAGSALVATYDLLLGAFSGNQGRSSTLDSPSYNPPVISDQSGIKSLVTSLAGASAWLDGRVHRAQLYLAHMPAMKSKE
jgi:hypothetical protein